MRWVDSLLSPSPPARPSLRDRGIWLVVLSVTLVTLLHWLTDTHLFAYHSIYRSLYYLPIAVAAVRYGRAGGLAVALLVCALYLPHVLLTWGQRPSSGLNDLLESGVFVFVGVLTGALVDAERHQRRRAQQSAEQLAAINTRLHLQAAAAQQTHAAIAAILESIDSGVITLDSSGQITRVNAAARRLLDGGDGQQAPLPDEIHRYLADGTTYQQLTLGQRTLGLHRAPLKGPHGEPDGTVLVLDNLTELRALEEQIQRAERLSALGRLSSGLAHEIRNPLGIVRAAAQILHGQLEPPGQLSEYTRIIQSEVDRVDRLLEELLAYARPRPLNRALLHTGALIERTVSLTQVYATQRGVALTAEVEDGLPTILGDSDLLHQALVNLVLNSIQATPPGGAVRVSVCVQPMPHPTLELAVSDNGQGIRPEDLNHIFDPFFTTRSDGTGLGLSIVQQIAQAHGGTIAVSSELGRGTRCVLSLPVKGEAPPEARG